MTTLIGPLRRATQIAADRPAVVCGEVELTYAQTWERCRHLVKGHPAVLETAVFGIPDEHWGDAVHAVVVPRTPVTDSGLIDHCRNFIAGCKVPKSVELRTEPLPKSGAGKVLKRELRGPYWAGTELRVAGA